MRDYYVIVKDGYIVAKTISKSVMETLYEREVLNFPKSTVEVYLQTSHKLRG